MRHERPQLKRSVRHTFIEVKTINKNKFSRHDPASYDEVEKWRSICPEGEYRVVAPEKLSGLLPNDLLQKINSALVIASASASPPATVFLANTNRIDRPTSSIDQEPYLAVFFHSASAASGGFVHHGGWSGRTTKMKKDFFEAIHASGIDVRYPLKEMPPSDAGPIDKLTVDSHHQAYWTAVYKYQKAK